MHSALTDLSDGLAPEVVAALLEAQQLAAQVKSAQQQADAFHRRPRKGGAIDHVHHATP